MRAKVAAEQAGWLERQIVHRKPAQQILGQLGTGQLVHPRAQFRHHAHPDLIGRYPVIQQPITGLGEIQRLRQQVVHVQHFDTLIVHRLRKDIVVFLRLLDPEHVVKQQILTVRGGQAAVRQTGATYDDLAQFAGFRMNAQSMIGHIETLSYRIAAMLREAVINTSRISRSGQMKTSQRS
jgi:hypothetical protein